MATITDTSILHWLPFDDNGGEPWNLALINAENQKWNSTDLNNNTSTLAMMAASKQGVNSSLMSSPAQLGLATGLLLSLLINSRIWTAKANREGFGSKLLFGEPKPYQWILHLTPSSSFTFASSKTFILPYLYLLPLLAIILLLPLLFVFAIILLPFAIYRFVVFTYLQHRSGDRIKKNLFPGADAVWTFNESNESYSVINALILLEGQPDIFKLREILRTRLGAFPKLRMRHGFTLGYATWHEDPSLDIGSLVQWLPGKWGNTDSEDNKKESRTMNCSSFGCCEKNIDSIDERSRSNHSRGRLPNNKCKSNYISDENISCMNWNRKNLCKIVEKLCNMPLPEGHTASWEARVGKALPWEESSSEELDKCNTNIDCELEASIRSTVFPILFRIHHSIGDGASLLQLLMSTLIDNESESVTPTLKQSHEITLNSTSTSRPLTLQIASSKIETQNSHLNKQRIPKTISNVEAGKIEAIYALEKAEFNNGKISHDSKNAISDHCPHKLNTAVGSSTKNERSNSLSQDPVIKKQTETTAEKESSFLYGRRLSGKKMIYWDSNSVTVEEIKKIRAATGVKFTEILLSAISAALSGYWEARKNGMLNDDPNATKKCSKKNHMAQKVEGYKTDNTISPDVESEDEWDKLEDVPEESEDEGCQEKYRHVTTATKDIKLENPPSSVKLVLPAILGSLFQKPKVLTVNGCNELENLFSVAVMTLPVGKSGGCPLERLSKVSDASGYMMPLRKDSIYNCKSKIKHYTFNRKATTNSLQVKGSSVPLMNSESKSVKSPSGVIPQNTTNNEVSNSKLIMKESQKTASINPHGSEVLTYYYTTKQAEAALESNPQVSFTLKKDSTVQYHKNEDSAKLIISNKEPYGCPTTIFFTQNNQSNINSCLYKEAPMKHISQAQVTSKQGSCNQEVLNKKIGSTESPNAKTISADSKSQNGMIDKYPANKADRTFVSNVTKTSQTNLKSSTSSLQLPSSPTIQHLLTRWLALDIVATVLPSIFAAPMMSIASKGVAVVMSNLPGPPKKLHSILGGHPLKDIVFWAPHRGYTGLGLTILSYDGRLHIGLMADEAVIPTQRGAEFILSTVLDELHSLGAAVSATH